MTSEHLHKILPWVVMAAVAAMFFLLRVENHSECEDSFDYALAIETKSYPALVHSHHQSYHLTGKVLYEISGRERSFPVLLLFGQICSVIAAALFYRVLRTRLSWDVVSACFATLLLCAWYGTWRYAYAVESYAYAAVWALLFTSAVFGMGTQASPSGSSSRAAVAVGALGALGALALLAQIQLIPLVFGSAPLYLLLRHGWRRAGIYTGVAAMLYLPAAAGLQTWRATADDLGPEKVARIETAEADERLSVRNATRLAAALGQSLVSANFVFADPRISDLLSTTILPHHNLAEEIETAKSIPPSGVRIRWLTFLLALLSLGVIAALGLFCRGSHFVVTGGIERSSRLAVDFFAVWLAGHTVMIAVAAPAGPEMWILALIPLTVLLVTPVKIAVERRTLPAFGWPALWTAALVILAHNYVGGMEMLRDRSHDFNYQRSAWLIENAGPDDVIFTHDNEVFSHYLRYHCRAPVRNLYWRPFEEMVRIYREEQKNAADGAGRLFVVEPVVHPPPDILRNWTGDGESPAATFAKWIAGMVAPVEGVDFVWLQKPDAGDGAPASEIEPVKHPPRQQANDPENRAPVSGRIDNRSVQ